MKLSALVSILLMLSIPASQLRADPVDRELGTLQVRVPGRLFQSRSLSSLLGAGNSVLIVLDTRSAVSLRLIDQLRPTGFAGEGAIVVVLDADADSLRRMQSFAQWPQARWVAAAARSVIDEMGIEGAPAVYGMAGTQMRWRESGLPRQGGDRLVLRMLDWIAQPLPVRVDRS